MKLALQITSWIAVVIGALALVGYTGDPYTLVGALLFLGQGVLALLYIRQQDKE